MKTRALLIAVLCLSVISCQRDKFEVAYSSEDSGLPFNASLDASTKTYLVGTQVRWELYDKISLWYGTLDTAMTRSDYFVGKVESDARHAVLNGFAKESDDYIAVYPRFAAMDCSMDGKLTIGMPMEQSIKEGSFAPGANVSVAYSNTTDLSFKNIGGLMAFKVASTGGHLVKKIRLTGTAAMAGEVEIEQAGVAAGEPAVDAVIEGINFLAMDCGDGIKDLGKDSGTTEFFYEEDGNWGDTKSVIFSGDNVFYLVSLPGAHTGFVLTFIDSKGKTAVAKSNYTFTINRNSNTLIANISLTDAMFREDPGIYINEVDCKNKKIELYNPNNEAVDLSGWILTKEEHTWAFPLGSSIPAKGYYVVNCKQPGCSTGPMFGLSGDNGFDLRLSNGGVVDHVDNLTSITAIANGETYGRRTDGADEWVVFSSGTIYNGTTCDGDNSKGTVKGDTPVTTTNVVVNEIDGNVKFIELYNKGSEAVSLEGWTLEKNDEAVWTGTSSNIIAAGSHFVVYSSKCSSIPSGAPVFSGGISPKQTLKVSLKLSNGNVTDNFTRGASPWGGKISECSDSFGRTPDGTGGWQLINSTPGTANGASKGDIPQN